jgi:hypothetical protein
MLALLTEPAGAAPLYFSSTGTHQWNDPNRAPTSYSTTVSVTIDLDKRTFGWTADPGSVVGHSCSEPTKEDKEDTEMAVNRRGKYQGLNLTSRHCNDAWANDLEYRFQVTDETTTWNCLGATGSSCEMKEILATRTSGEINRLTGKLSAKRTHDHVDKKAGFKDEGQDEWHMTCTITDRRF